MYLKTAKSIVPCYFTWTFPVVLRIFVLLLFLQVPETHIFLDKQA